MKVGSIVQNQFKIDKWVKVNAAKLFYISEMNSERFICRKVSEPGRESV